MKSNQYNSYIQWYNAFKDIPNVVKVVNNNMKNIQTNTRIYHKLGITNYAQPKIYLSRLYLPYIQGQLHVLWEKHLTYLKPHL